MTAESAMTLSTVWACVNAIAGKVSVMPFNVMRKVDEGKQPLPGHRLQSIINIRPNFNMTRNVYFERALMHILLWGDHFAIPEKPSGRISSLTLLHPTQVRVLIDEFGLKYICTLQNSKERILRSEEIIHVPGLGDGIRGKSVISKAAEDFGWALANRKHGANFFKKGGRQTGILENKNAKGLDLLKNKQQLDELRKDWAETYNTASGENLVITPFGLEYKTITSPQDDFQFIKTHEFQTETICRWFNVDKEVVQAIQNSNYAQYGAVQQAFAFKSLLPHTEKIETEYKLKLFGIESPEFPEFDFKILLKPDPKTRAEVQSKEIASGVLSQNEARAANGRNSFTGGDKYYINSAFIPTDLVEGFWKSKFNKN